MLSQSHIPHLSFFFFNDTATTEIYTLSLTTLFRSRRLALALALEANQPAAQRSGAAAHQERRHDRPQLVPMFEQKDIVHHGTGSGCASMNRWCNRRTASSVRSRGIIHVIRNDEVAVPAGSIPDAVNAAVPARTLA